MANITYRITIEKIEHDVPFKARNWKQLVNQPDEKHENIYGYVEVDTTKDVETKIFEQVVHDLDLAKVVLTINSK
jgi:hypothetical protein